MLLCSVLRQPDGIASLRFGCPSAVACRPPASTHLLYTQSRFRTAWCRHLYMATMASPVPVRSASIADGPLACFSQTHSQLYWPSPVCSSARSTRSAPSAVVTGDDEFQFLRRMTTHPNSTIAAEVLFEIAAQTASSCLSHEPLRQAQIQCSLGKENRHPPVTTGLRMPSVLLFQPTPSK